jgi:hypothetical protein
MKILFHNVASKPDGCTIIAVFEVKKEIPVEKLMAFRVEGVPFSLLPWTNLRL